MSHSLRIALFQDHPLTSEGIRVQLEAAGHVIALMSTDGWDVARAREHRVDVAIVDLALKDGGGAKLVRTLLDDDVPSVVLSGFPAAAGIEHQVRSGALAVVLKTAPVGMIVRAVEAAARKERFLCVEAQRVLDATPSPGIGARLTPREVEVLEAIAEGLTNKEVAERLGVRLRTAETHRERLMAKLGVHNSAGLTRAAVAIGLVGPRPS